MSNEVNIQEILSDKIKTDEFIKKNKPLVLRVINDVYPSVLNTYEKEDYIQEGLLSLYKAMIKYDDSRKIKFCTFAYIVIKMDLLKRIHNEQNKINQCKPNVYSMNSKIKIDDDLEYIDVLEDSNDIENNIINTDDYNKLYSSLKPTYQQILLYLADGFNQADIARKLGCSRENIRQKISAIRKIAKMRIAL